MNIFMTDELNDFLKDRKWRRREFRKPHGRTVEWLYVLRESNTASEPFPLVSIHVWHVAGRNETELWCEFRGFTEPSDVYEVASILQHIQELARGDKPDARRQSTLEGRY